MSREVRVELDDGSVLRCGCSPDLAIHVGDQCVVSAYNVLEFGRVVRMTNSPGPESDEESVSKVLRRATLQDQAKARENALYQKMSADTCVKKLETSGTDVQIISVRHSFDRKVVTIVYTADERIQSRDIINELSTELGARIEMKQIGGAGCRRPLRRGRAMRQNALLQFLAETVRYRQCANGQESTTLTQSEHDKRRMRSAEMLPSLRECLLH